MCRECVKINVCVLACVKFIVRGLERVDGLVEDNRQSISRLFFDCFFYFGVFYFGGFFFLFWFGEGREM